MKFFVRAKHNKKVFREISIEVSFDKDDIVMWVNQHKDGIYGAELTCNGDEFGFTYLFEKKQLPMAASVINTAWTRALELLVTIKVQTISARTTKLGTIKATSLGDPDYPEIFTFVQRPDGVEIDIAAIDANDERIKHYLYGDTSSDAYTEERVFSADEINVEA